MEGFYFRPRIDKEILAAHSEGLVCLSGCVSSELNRGLLMGNAAGMEKAREAAAWYHKVFGDRYFIEIQYNGIEQQRIAMEGAIELANGMGLPLVATGNVHYVLREDAEAQDILLCDGLSVFILVRNSTITLKWPVPVFPFVGDLRQPTVGFQHRDDLVGTESVVAGCRIGQRQPPSSPRSSDSSRCRDLLPSSVNGFVSLLFSSSAPLPASAPSSASLPPVFRLFGQLLGSWRVRFWMPPYPPAFARLDEAPPGACGDRRRESDSGPPG